MKERHGITSHAALFRSKSFHRIDRGGPASGQDSSQHRNDQQSKNRCADGYRISTACLEKQRACKMRAYESTDESRQNPDSRQGSRLPQDQKQDICSGSSNGHPYPDFACALCDGIGGHSINANGRKRERQQREDTKQNSGHLLPRQGVGEYLIDGLDVVDGLIWIEFPDGIAHFSGDAGWINIGAKQNYRMGAESRQVQFG